MPCVNWPCVDGGITKRRSKLKKLTAVQQNEQESDENRMRQLHRDFRQRYAPDDPMVRDHFEADLAILMREVAMDTSRQFQDAMAAQLAFRPMVPQFIYRDTKEGD